MKFVLCILGALFSQLVEGNPTESNVPYQRYTSCLEGWYQYENTCYRIFGKSPKDWLTWDGARDACSSFGAQLASIHSQEEQDFLVMYLQLNVEYAFWIGLNDREIKRNFEWLDNSPVNYTNWNFNEPSNGNRENCVEVIHSINVGGLGKWNDQACDYRIPYLCQMPTDPRLSNENPQYCPVGQKGASLFDSCYTHVDLPMTWPDAESYCQKTFGGHLASITDDGIQKFLTYVSRELGVIENLWIGMKGSETTGTKTVPLWSSGWYLSYTKWVNSSQQLRGETCVSFLKSGYWEVTPCDKTFPFICEVSKVPPPKLEPSVEGSQCPEVSGDWKDLGGDYCYYFNTNDNVNAYEANFQCLLRGGTLASLHFNAESVFFEQFLRYKVGSVHIGLIQKYNNRFSWVDGSKLNFQHWDVDEPRPNTSNQRCVQVLAFLRSMRWSVKRCEARLPYVCSVKKNAPNTTVSDNMIN